MTSLRKLSQYGKGFQLKVLNSLLADRKFLLQVRDVLVSDYFDSEAHQWIVKQILAYYDKYHTTITLDVLRAELQKEENEVLKVAIKQDLKNAYTATKDDIEYVQHEFSDFCKNQELTKALSYSIDLLESGEFDAIRTAIESALKAGMDKNIGHEYKKDTESRFRDDYRATIPTPWPIINQGIQGGIGPGDLVIMFGNPGGGKSWAMVDMAAHALKLGYNVNYYTLELGETYVGKRFDCNLSGIPIDEIREKRELVNNIVNGLKGNLIVKEYPPKGASISTIDAHIQQCKDLDLMPDLVIIDYIDYLKPPNRSYAEKKDAIDDNYIAAKGLGKKHGIPVVSPSQVNRMGAKDNVIEGDKAAGSYDKMMVADICWSLSRKKEDKVLGTGRLHLMKNRYGDDGKTYNILMDTSTGRIQVDEEYNDVDNEFGDYLTPSAKAIARDYFKLEQ